MYYNAQQHTHEFVPPSSSSSSFWLPTFLAGDLAKERRVIAYDFDGHGKSQWSARQNLSIADLVQDLKEIVQVLQLPKIILLGHSMNGVSVLEWPCVSNLHRGDRAASTRACVRPNSYGLQ